jgi:hypothetical protein
MLLSAIQSEHAGVTWRSIVNDLPMDLGTVVVALVLFGVPLLMWWANRPSTMERYSTDRRPEADSSDPELPARDEEKSGEPVRPGGRPAAR